MPKQNAPLLAWNRGLVSPLALSRVDVERIRLSAEIMDNWMPKTQGAMILRPGFQYLGTSRSNAQAIDVPFVASTTDTALIEITAGGRIRVNVNDQLVTREAVATTITNSDFSSSTGWTDGSVNGGVVSFVSGLRLNATTVTGLAVCSRLVSVSAADRGKRHALKIRVARGPVTFRCGSTAVDDDYISETPLRTGEHSLAFTPTANFFIQFQSDQDVQRIVTECSIEPAGVMELFSPWAEDDLPLIRYDQSADVVFIACKGHQQRRLERRAVDSWSLVLYQPANGPFSTGRSSRVKLKVAVTSGNTTLTSDLPFFRSDHVGALFRLFNPGVNQTYSLASGGAFTEPFRVSGIKNSGSSGYNDRDWTYSISGTWAGTLRWYRSFDGPEDGFQQFRNEALGNTIDITTNVSGKVNEDEDNNAVIYYKLGFEEGAYTSGAATVQITYDGAGGHGICRVTGITSSTVAQIEVLERFNTTDYTDAWEEGIWSNRRGWSTAVSLHRGRLWWFGGTRFIGSVSDDFENFDHKFEGDAGPINRTLGTGPVDTINFSLSLSRLIVGTPGSEVSIKSTSFDEPITPQNAQAGDPSSQGSRLGVNAAKVDNRGVFAQRSGKRLFELVLDSDSYDYTPRDLTLLCPDLTGGANVAGIAVQRQPDTRIHVWLDDGTVVVLTYEPSEEVVCWSRLSLPGGFVECVSVLPGEDEDNLYYRVRRTISGQTRRYLEKMALESECKGGTLNKQADSFVLAAVVSGAVSGLSHLEGQQVIVWGGGRYLGKYTVTAGGITLSQSFTGTAVVGLQYEAPYKSTKLAYAAAAGTALNQIKRVNFVGVIMGTVHNKGLMYGRDFQNMDPLPRLFQGRRVGEDEVFNGYDEPAFSFPGSWSADSRLHLMAMAPFPCELMAAVVTVETHDKA